jgi:AraC-like DNA-binding protein
MQQVPRPLLVLHKDRALREQLREIATEQRLHLSFVEDWGMLHEQVRSAPGSAVVVVDPFEGAPADGIAATEVSRLVQRFPSLTVAAAIPVGPGSETDIRRLGETGVVELIDLVEESTPVAVGQRLQATRGRRLRILLERALPPRMSGLARSIIAAAAEVVADGGQGSDLAERMTVTTRTLSRWCRRAALPPPKRLLAWMRILAAADLIDDPGRTMSDVAASCGYAADTSLRHALRAFLGRGPRELREQGAFSAASEAFVQALIEARSQDKRYRARSDTAA